MEEQKVFDKTRHEFTPYGLTCEKWKPQASPRIDRHNEIEINYFPEGGATYLFSNRVVDVPAERFIMFWALFPHKTMAFRCEKPYYTCTIPFSTFLSWKVNAQMQNHLMGGHIVVSPDGTGKALDELLLKRWHYDLARQAKSKDLQEAVILEMRARINRLALDYRVLECLPTPSESPFKGESRSLQLPLERGRVDTTDAKGVMSDVVDKVSQLVLFISQNHGSPLRLTDVGKAIGLHPDYANTLCRKAFGCTIHEYLLQERINHAERLLITTDQSISNIALESGFTTIARFNAAFQKFKSCTPSEYRRAIHATIGTE